MRGKVETLLKDALDERPELFLIDLNISEANQIRVIIDGDEGVSVQDCIDVSRAIEHNLDREEQDFSLEVLSAGVSEPLTMVRQYQKNVGRKLKVKTSEESFEGNLVKANDDTITLTKDSYENIDSWLSKELSFKEEPLHNVLSDISKHFKTNFVVDQELDIKSSCLLTSTFENPTIEEVIKELKTILDAKIIKQNNSYVIVSINC